MRLFLLLLISIIIILIYSKLFLGFFQQDEWLAFGKHIMLADLNLFEFIKNTFIPASAHYTPLTSLSIGVLFYLFSLDFISYAITSVALHIIAVLLVFYLAKQLFKKDILAYAVAILYGLSFAGYQATTWVVADIATHGSTIFGLLSIISLLNFLKGKKMHLFFISISCLLVSLLFKEITVGLFIILPMIFYIYADSGLKKRIIFPVFFIGIIIFFISLRFLLLINIQIQVPIVPDTNKSILAANIVLYPLKTVVQTIIPSNQLVKTARLVTNYLPENIRGQNNTTSFDIFAEKRVLPFIEFLLFLLISGIVLSLGSKSRDYDFRKVIFISFIFIIVNSIVYVLSPERSGLIAAIDSRNLYFPLVGTCILVIALLVKIAGNRSLRIFVFLLPLLALNIFWLNKETTALAHVSSLRKNILNKIQKEYPNLPEKVMFYTESDQSYYGLPEKEKILPFQSGFGQTLIIWYSKNKALSRDFLQERFLWQITDQDYKEINGRGFGYFRDFDELVKAIEENNLDVDSIIAFSFDSQENILTNSSEELKGRLKGYEASKNERKVTNLKIVASENNKDVYLMLDRDETTYWNSKKPYQFPQTLDIELEKEAKINHIQIYSGNNKDQNNVGYEILTSNDNKTWKKVFYVKSLFPKDGIVNIYLPPDKKRFIKINQIGKHKYASWVINELNIFESNN